MRTIITLLGLTTALAASPAAQSVIGLQPLAFGVVLPGVPSTVLKTDPVKAGRFTILGAANQRVNLDLILPANLTGPGTPMPLTFGPGSAGYAEVNDPAQASNWNPKNTANKRLSPGGQGWVFLGGTVSPAAGQTPGTYTNTVVLVVVFN